MLRLQTSPSDVESSNLCTFNVALHCQSTGILRFFPITISKDDCRTSTLYEVVSTLFPEEEDLYMGQCKAKLYGYNRELRDYNRASDTFLTMTYADAKGSEHKMSDCKSMKMSTFLDDVDLPLPPPGRSPMILFDESPLI